MTAMNPRSIVMAIGLLASLPISAQVVSTQRLSLENADDEDGPGWQTVAVLSVPSEAAGQIISFDAKKSAVDEVTDASTGQPVKVKTKFMSQSPMRSSREDVDFGVHLTVTAPPEVPSAWLKIKGTLVFNTVVETKKHKVVIKLVDGTSFKAGDHLLTVKDVREWGDSMGFSLTREDGSFSAVYDIRFSDADGNAVLVNRSGGGSSSRDGKIISESRSFRCPSGHEELHAEFEMVAREDSKEVPFDTSVPVNP